MPKRSRKKGKKLDLNELASSIIQEATNPQPTENKPKDQGKNPAAAALGRLGGLKGGKARAKKLTKKQRSDSARKAAVTRWRSKIKKGKI